MTNKYRINNNATIISLGLISLTFLSGAILSSVYVSADDTSVVDEINITVPISCTMSGTGMNTHNATIPNGIYSGIMSIHTSSMFNGAGYYATTWSVITPQTNGNSINNTTSRLYGQNTSTYTAPPSGRSFTLAQP